MDDAEDQLNWSRRSRLLQTIDRLVDSGRVTEMEAERLRTAAQPSDFERVVREIRVRHAGARLDAAVEEGSLSRHDADGFLDRLRGGEHPRSLRAQLPGPHAADRSRGADSRS